MRADKWLGLLPRQTQPHPKDGFLFFRWWFFESAFQVSASTARRLRRLRLLSVLMFVGLAAVIWQSFPERCATLNPIWWCNWREISLWALPILIALFYHQGTRRLLLPHQQTGVRLSLCGRMVGQGFSGIGKRCTLLAILASGLLWLSLLDWWLFEQPLLQYYGLAGSAHLGTIALIGLALEDAS